MNEMEVKNNNYINEMEVKNNNYINVVCAADNSYAMPLAVTVRSVIKNLKENRKIKLFIIDGGINKQNKEKILRSLENGKCVIEWLPQPDRLLGNFEVQNQFTIENIPGVGTVTAKPYLSNIAAYYRLLIPNLLPECCQKAIYLDCDLIVTRDLGELWDIEIGNNYLLAVQEFLTPYVSSPAGLMNYKELGISLNAKYFNSGVLVINLEKWRANNAVAKAVDYLQQNGKYVRWADTDVLNALVANQWGQLDPRWNQTASVHLFSSSQEEWQDCPLSEALSYETYKKVLQDPYIIHFSSTGKPWNTSQDEPFKKLFFQYLDLTAWSGWRYTIWRRVWRKLSRKIKKTSSFLLQPKTV